MVQEHEHAHPPGTAPVETEQGIDLAGQSLGQALRLSFLLLTGIIVVLILFFFGRGAFKVPPDQKVVVLRFGRAAEKRVKDEGLHYAWPSPIDEVVRLSVKSRPLTVNTFWPTMTDYEREQAIEKAERGEDVTENVFGAKGAYMLTGDLNIVESRWSVVYNVRTDAASLVKYFRNVAIDERYPYDDNRRYTQERALVKNALQAAVVREISALPVTKIYPPQRETDLPRRVLLQMRSLLDDLDCGLEVAQVNLLEIRPPEDVKVAFDAVLAAIQAAEELRIAAEREAKQSLIRAAGDVGPDLGEAIDGWWKAREKNDTEMMEDKEKEIQKIFALAQGEVRTTLASAETYKTTIVEETQGDAKTISDLVAQSPVAIRMSLEVGHVKTLQKVFQACYEKFLFRPMDGAKSTLEIWLNRRPEIRRKEKVYLDIEKE